MPGNPQRSGVQFVNADQVGEDLGACPWCGRRIAADPSVGSVAHALPTCSTFDQLNALEFVTAVRKRLQERAEN